MEPNRDHPRGGGVWELLRLLVSGGGGVDEDGRGNPGAREVP